MTTEQHNDTASPKHEAWQADAEDSWDKPVRQILEEGMPPADYEKTWQEFTSFLGQTSLYHFQESFARQMRSTYPVGLVRFINQRFGANLRPAHVQRAWNDQFGDFANRLHGELREDFDPSRLATLFSRLLADRMTDDDQIELAIPAAYDGTLNGVGLGLRHGTLVVHGNTGDYTGYRMSQLGQLQVHGSVGDYAGAFANTYASLHISGSAGDNLGHATTGSTGIAVEGNVGDRCGERMCGVELLIKVGGNAGHEVGYNAERGTIRIHGKAASIASPVPKTLKVQVLENREKTAQT